MSDYTDYMALLTEATTLQDLRGELEQLVPWARVDLNFINETGEMPPEAQWAALPKPQWVTVQTPALVGDLMSLGTAFHLMVEKDFQSWGVELLCGGDAWSYALLAPGAASDGLLTRVPPLLDPMTDTDRVTAMAGCLKVDETALRATLIPDGGQSFSAVLGVQYYLFQDQKTAEPPTTGTVQFHTMYEG